MEEVGLENYIHDFVFIHWNIHVKPPAFLYDLMLSISDKKGSEESGFAHTCVALHFTCQLYEKFMRNNSAILRILNEVDLQLRYDPGTWRQFGVEVPVDLLGSSKFTDLCQYVLIIVSELFSNVMISCQNNLDAAYLWDKIYTAMVSMQILLMLYELMFIADIC